ncbi:glycosyltransferase [Cellulomonas sp. NPDC057328]|uniref:glycosyltransferase n=1 Tax=Cellulomonas sp. NPDC057328 TaxID=3346101 RepID=UPI003643C778
MKVLLAADMHARGRNGVSSFTMRLARGLRGKGHHVVLICPSADGRPGVIQVDGLDVETVRSRWIPGHDVRYSLSRDALPIASRLVERMRPDVVHVQTHFGIGHATLTAAELHGVPVVATNHFLPENLTYGIPIPRCAYDLLRRRLWARVQRVYGRASMVTGPTKFAVAALREHARLEGGAVISGGVDAGRFRSSPGCTKGVVGAAPTVLFVGRLDPEKRVGDLLSAFAAVASNTSAMLEIVGDGRSRRRLERRARTLGLSDAIAFHGAVDVASLTDIYARSDVFCMPSVAELQSLATLEAMAAGIPVIAARSPALEELVEHERSGFLYRGGDAAELSRFLTELLTDASLRQEMGRRGLRIADGHSLDGTVEGYVRLYADLIEFKR